MLVERVQYSLQVGLRPKAIIVDSIQTVYLDHVTGSAGSVSQVGAGCFWGSHRGAVQQQADPVGDTELLKAVKRWLPACCEAVSGSTCRAAHIGLCTELVAVCR